MKYYAINMIKGHMNEVFFKNNTSKEERRQFNDLINLVHLNEVLGFDKIHLGAGADIRNVFDEDQMEKVNLYLMMKNKAFLIPEKTLKKAIYKQDNIMTFEYQTPEDLITARIAAEQSPDYIMNQLKEEQIAAEKKALYAISGDVTGVDFDNKTYLSIDFEFNPMAVDKFHIRQIVEVGLSYIHGEDITTEHYIVNEHRDLKSDRKKKLQDSFNFGTSKFIDSADVIGILEDALTKSGNLVFHDKSCDIRYFERNKISLDNHRIYDTQAVYKYNISPDGESSNSKRLKDFLDDNMIDSKNTHNAGNDAHYTSMVFKAQVYEILNQPKKLVKTHSIQP
jgi:hypothetical protein